MMDIFFQDPNEIPLPPEDVRIRKFTAVLWPDGRRVRVYLEVDPFQNRPCAQIEIINQKKKIIAEVNIIETITRKMELNMHLRESEPGVTYKVQANLYYQQFPSAEDAGKDSDSSIPEKQVIDEAERTLEIPAQDSS